MNIAAPLFPSTILKKGFMRIAMRVVMAVVLSAVPVLKTAAQDPFEMVHSFSNFTNYGFDVAVRVKNTHQSTGSSAFVFRRLVVHSPDNFCFVWGPCAFMNRSVAVEGRVDQATFLNETLFFYPLPTAVDFSLQPFLLDYGTFNIMTFGMGTGSSHGLLGCGDPSYFGLWDGQHGGRTCESEGFDGNLLFGFHVRTGADFDLSRDPMAFASSLRIEGQGYFVQVITPEPGTWALLATGLLALAFATKRRGRA